MNIQNIEEIREITERHRLMKEENLRKAKSEVEASIIEAALSGESTIVLTSNDATACGKIILDCHRELGTLMSYFRQHGYAVLSYQVKDCDYRCLSISWSRT